VAIGEDPDEGLRDAPDDVLDRNRKREVGRGQADVADHVRLEEAPALAHAHREAQHDGGAAKDRPGLGAGEVGLLHGSNIPPG